MKETHNISLADKAKAIKSLLISEKPEINLEALHANHVTIYQFSSFTLDYYSYELLDQNGCSQILTTGLFNLLMIFLLQPRRIISRAELSAHSQCIASDDKRNVDIAICRLRNLLGQEGKKLIKTVRKRGYMLTASVTINRQINAAKPISL